MYPFTCRRCRERIPRGRNFCAPHYQEALAEYEHDRAVYEKELYVWHSFSDLQRAAASVTKEKKTMRFGAGLLGFLLGCTALLVSVMTRPAESEPGAMDTLLALLPIVLPLAFLKIEVLTIIFGRIYRTLLNTVPYSIAVLVIMFVLAAFVPDIETHYWTYVSWPIAAIATIIGIREFIGKNHGSAAPREPSIPSA